MSEHSLFPSDVTDFLFILFNPVDHHQHASGATKARLTFLLSFLHVLQCTTAMSRYHSRRDARSNKRQRLQEEPAASDAPEVGEQQNEESAPLPHLPAYTTPSSLVSCSQSDSRVAGGMNTSSQTQQQIARPTNMNPQHHISVQSSQMWARADGPSTAATWHQSTDSRHLDEELPYSQTLSNAIHHEQSSYVPRNIASGFVPLPSEDGPYSPLQPSTSQTSEIYCNFREYRG